MNNEISKRRDFIKGMSLAGMALALSGEPLFANHKKASNIKIGLVTYLWGKDWDLPTLIRNCEKSNVLGVELRTEHKHGVGPTLTVSQRKEVKKRFANSGVTLLGYGSNVRFDSPSEEDLQQNIVLAKVLLMLCHDVGGSGLKVKPNGFHESVPREKTLEQIGRSLNEVGKFAGDLGQQIRLEVHGQGTQELPNIKTIMDVADNRNVTVCWNSNPQDLKGNGLEYNFNLVKHRLGDVIHIHEMNLGDYPYQELMNLLVEIDYSGWMLLECGTNPQNKVQALIQQREVWKKMLAKALV